MRASFACEALDESARLVSIDSAQEMQQLALYLTRYAHTKTHMIFWSGGHRGNVAAKQVDKESLKYFYWHNDTKPMNYSNFRKEPSTKGTHRRFAAGFCLYLEAVGSELIMNSAHCKELMAFACEKPF